MFLESFKITSSAVGQIFILAALGYFLVKRNILSDAGLDALNRLTIEFAMPVLIFCQLLENFSFRLYPNWWIFPLISIAVTLAGLFVAFLFFGLIKGEQHKIQFLSVVTFQNAGYLPLALLAALLPKDKLDTIFIYLFLFLLGFNLIIWSVGAYMLTFTRAKKFDLATFFSPIVIATIASLIFVFLGLNKFIPQVIFKPLFMFGNCTLPLAMLVVGGNLAQLKLAHIHKKDLFYIILAKMIILPALGLFFAIKFKLPELVGLLILIQLAMPAATSLSLIARQYKKEDLLVSQGIFYSHIASIVTIPLFLSLYYMWVVRL